MPVQSLIWTALPNGRTADGRFVRLSLLVSPRLEPESANPELSSFPDFVDWPATLAKAVVNVHIGGSTIALTTQQIDTSIGVADSTVWRALLPPTTHVKSFRMTDHTATQVLSFDAVALHDTIRKVYASLTASAGEELPSIEKLRANAALAPVIEGVTAVDDLHKGLQRDIDDEVDEWQRSGFKGLAGAGTMLGTFQLFHTPLAKQETESYTPDDPRLAAKWRTHERAKIDAAEFV